MSENTNACSATMRDRLKEYGVKGDVSTISEDLLSRVLDGWDTDRSQIETLQKDAELGVQYRDDLVEEALKAGVRAQGEDFDKDMYDGILRGLRIEQIRKMRDDWTRDGDKRLSGGKSDESPGGRRSTDGDEPLRIVKADEASSRDDRAYAG